MMFLWSGLLVVLLAEAGWCNVCPDLAEDVMAPAYINVSMQSPGNVTVLRNTTADLNWTYQITDLRTNTDITEQLVVHKFWLYKQPPLNTYYSMIEYTPLRSRVPWYIPGSWKKYIDNIQRVNASGSGGFSLKRTLPDVPGHTRWFRLSVENASSENKEVFFCDEVTLKSVIESDLKFTAALGQDVFQFAGDVNDTETFLPEINITVPADITLVVTTNQSSPAPIISVTFQSDNISEPLNGCIKQRICERTISLPRIRDPQQQTMLRVSVDFGVQHFPLVYINQPIMSLRKEIPTTAESMTTMIEETVTAVTLGELPVFK